MFVAAVSTRIAVSGKKYNIDPKYQKSPYLSRPFSPGSKQKRKSTDKLLAVKRRNREDGGESVATRDSFRTQLTTTTHRTSATTRTSGVRSHSNARNLPTKNLLLPREMDKLLKSFRQRHSDHPILKDQQSKVKQGNNSKDDDDNSTIASSSAQSLDDMAVYKNCLQNKDVSEILFSGPVFSELTVRPSERIDNYGSMLSGGITLPPVMDGLTDQDDDVSDLGSCTSATNRLKQVYQRRR